MLSHLYIFLYKNAVQKRKGKVKVVKVLVYNFYDFLSLSSSNTDFQIL